ncbi:MAG: hypothetical protein ACLQUT_05605 [Thermoleophilia bacterium]
MAAVTHRSAAVWTLLLLLLLQAISGLAGGASLVAKPSGDVFKMPVANLRGSPFHDYLIPGLILLLVLGAGPLITLVGLWRRQAWAWFAAFAIGCGLIIWIVVEALLTPYSVLQVVYGIVGLLIALVTLVPSVRRYSDMRLLGSA